jgi:hypothetical protein
MMKLGFCYADVVEMPEEDVLGWLKASRPPEKTKKYKVVRKKK